jgi:hypothetical protein
MGGIHQPKINGLLKGNDFVDFDESAEGDEVDNRSLR